MRRMSYADFSALFPDNNSCVEYIWSIGYGDMGHCPRCAREAHYYRLKKRAVYSCGRCGFQIAPLAGTIFQNTKLPLSIWFYAMYCNSLESAISAKKLERILGVTYETAWGMLRKIRGV